MRLPSAEEWKDIQGGNPILLTSPTRKLVEIIHAYPNEETGRYTGPLAIVPTPIEQLLGSPLLRFASNGAHASDVPAALLWKHHGLPCEQRSGVPGSNYDRLAPHEVDTYISDRQAQGWQRTEPVRR